MKKILSILSTITLIITISTNTIACDDDYGQHSAIITHREVFADLGNDKAGMLIFDSKDNLYSSTAEGSNIYKIIFSMK